jgi:hypothetical protein
MEVSMSGSGFRLRLIAVVLLIPCFAAKGKGDPSSIRGWDPVTVADVLTGKDLCGVDLPIIKNLPNGSRKPWKKWVESGALGYVDERVTVITTKQLSEGDISELQFHFESTDRTKKIPAVAVLAMLHENRQVEPALKGASALGLELKGFDFVQGSKAWVRTQHEDVRCVISCADGTPRLVGLGRVFERDVFLGFRGDMYSGRVRGEKIGADFHSSIKNGDLVSARSIVLLHARFGLPSANEMVKQVIAARQNTCLDRMKNGDLDAAARERLWLAYERNLFGFPSSDLAEERERILGAFQTAESKEQQIGWYRLAFGVAIESSLSGVDQAETITWMDQMKKTDMFLPKWNDEALDWDSIYKKLGILENMGARERWNSKQTIPKPDIGKPDMDETVERLFLSADKAKAEMPNLSFVQPYREYKACLYRIYHLASEEIDSARRDGRIATAIVLELGRSRVRVLEGNMKYAKGLTSTHDGFIELIRDEEIAPRIKTEPSIDDIYHRIFDPLWRFASKEPQDEEYWIKRLSPSAPEIRVSLGTPDTSAVEESYWTEEREVTLWEEVEVKVSNMDAVLRHKARIRDARNELGQLKYEQEQASAKVYMAETVGARAARQERRLKNTGDKRIGDYQLYYENADPGRQVMVYNEGQAQRVREYGQQMSSAARRLQEMMANPPPDYIKVQEWQKVTRTRYRTMQRWRGWVACDIRIEGPDSEENETFRYPLEKDYLPDDHVEIDVIERIGLNFAKFRAAELVRRGMAIRAADNALKRSEGKGWSPEETWLERASAGYLMGGPMPDLATDPLYDPALWIKLTDAAKKTLDSLKYKDRDMNWLRSNEGINSCVLTRIEKAYRNKSGLWYQLDSGALDGVRKGMEVQCPGEQTGVLGTIRVVEADQSWALIDKYKAEQPRKAGAWILVAASEK